MGSDYDKTVTVIGAGLAGSEAAWQLANRGFQVNLFEMRPIVKTGAHESEYFAELVCSNSLGSNLPDRAAGLLKNELRYLHSLLLSIADQTAIPAGGALAVDRELYAQTVTQKLSQHKNISVIRQEVTEISRTPTIIASGPLTSPKLAEQIMQLSGMENLFFFDAIAPIIELESIDFSKAFRASRYGRGQEEEGDYINCPFSKSEYLDFVNELKSAERITLKAFEQEIDNGVQAGSDKYFEGCLPIEVLANRGEMALAFGPLRPSGLWDRRASSRPYAVLQLRQDNLAGNLYNMVGFQTNLTFSEQKRVFRKIPGLENAAFVRYGQMHRNTFIASPQILLPTLQFKTRKDLFFAGQITGVEGYVGNIATGLAAALNMARLLSGMEPIEFPQTTMIGSLLHYITHAELKNFQPMKANFGIMPPLSQKIKNKNDRFQQYSNRALDTLTAFAEEKLIYE
jgi:methylenetetrahydrofolate--tRNA-(uracil-5-)-methyltransferase